MTTDIQNALSASNELRGKLVDAYYALCDQRDATYAKAAPVEAELAKASAAVQAAQAVESDLACQVEAIWGPDWLALKREIANLARSLGRIPPRT